MILGPRDVDAPGWLWAAAAASALVEVERPCVEPRAETQPRSLAGLQHDRRFRNHRQRSLLQRRSAQR